MHHSLPRKSRRRWSVSVVVPCYRYGRYLPAAVAAALDQRHVDVRVIIVDDASPDDSLRVARDLAAHDDRVRVIAHEHNRGHIATYNDGLAAVETDLVTLVSADDLVAKGSLDRAAAFLERYPRVGLVYGKVDRFESSPSLVSGSRLLPNGLWRVWSGEEWASRIVMTGINPIYSPEAVVRTSVMHEIGEYDPLLPHAGDMEYWLRVAVGHDIGQIRGAVQAHYRVHGENMHLESSRGTGNIGQKALAMRVLGREPYASRAPWTTEHLRTGLRTLSREALAAASACIADGRLEEAEAFSALAREYVRDADGHDDAARPPREVSRERLA